MNVSLHALVINRDKIMFKMIGIIYHFQKEITWGKRLLNNNDHRDNEICAGIC